MGFKLVYGPVEKPGYTGCNVVHPGSFLPGGPPPFAIGLMRHSNPVSDRFDERAVGLDHFAMRVPDRAASKPGRSTSMTLGSRTQACWRKTEAP
jgi:hypothetical protein